MGAPATSGLLLGGMPAIAPATHYDDAYDAYGAGGVPAYEVDFYSPISMRPALLPSASAFPEFDTDAPAPF